MSNLTRDIASMTAGWKYSWMCSRTQTDHTDHVSEHTCRLKGQQGLYASVYIGQPWMIDLQEAQAYNPHDIVTITSGASALLWASRTLQAPCTGGPLTDQ